MNIEVISMWYNEEKIAPFFLKHYGFADKITIFLDDDTTDKSQEICKEYPNTTVVPFHFPDMLDDGLKAATLSRYAHMSECDWVINADADEFVFHKDMPLHDYLKYYACGDVVQVPFWQVYRHKTDIDLRAEGIIHTQRRHGDPRAGYFAGKRHIFNKPIIVRSRTTPEWLPGNHRVNIKFGIRDKRDTVQGVHWAMADPELAIARRMNGPLRQSQANKDHGWTKHQWDVTRDKVLEECQQHLNDPQVF
jgi:glycosyltransferase involved in cell wall biosynthesis